MGCVWRQAGAALRWVGGNGRALILAMAALLGGVGSAAAADSRQDALDDDLSALFRRGRVVLGVQAASFPFAYRASGHADPVGFSVDLCLRVVERLRAVAKGAPLRVEFVRVSSKNRIPLLLNGTIDLECGSTTATEARKALGGNNERFGVAFSEMIFWSDVAAAVPVKGTPANVRLVEQLPALTATLPLVTTSGSTSVRHLEAFEQAIKQPIRRSYAASHAEAFALLDRGDASAFVMDRVLLKGRLDPRHYRLLEGQLSSDDGERYGLMVRRTDDRLLRVVNETLRDLKRSGAFAATYRRWFLQPVPAPQDGSARAVRALHAAIGLPMSEQLVQASSNPTAPGASAP